MAKTALANKGSKYSDQDRYAAMACYAVHGNLTKCKDLLGIPVTTIHDWSKSEWWLSAIEQVRIEKQDEIDAGIQKIIDRSIESVVTRLDKGDEVITSKGETLYKAVSARDSATILGISFDKQRILRMLPTSISSAGNDDKLLNLLEKFEELAQEKTKQIEATVIAEG